MNDVPKAITRVRMRLTEDSPEEMPSQLMEALSDSASYSLTISFAGFSHPALARRFLDLYCQENPYSVLDLVLESADPDEHRVFLAETRELPLRPIPSLSFHPRFQARAGDACRPQLLRHVLCPVDALVRRRETLRDVRCWTVISAACPSLRKAVAIATAAGWGDGMMVRSDGISLSDGVLFAVYAYFLLGRDVNLRFADPALDEVYIRCLRQDASLPDDRTGRELYWDGLEVKEIESLDVLPPERWAGLIRAAGDVLGEVILDAVQREQVA